MAYLSDVLSSTLNIFAAPAQAFRSLFGARFKKIRRPARAAQDGVINAKSEQESGA